MVGEERIILPEGIAEYEDRKVNLHPRLTGLVRLDPLPTALRNFNKLPYNVKQLIDLANPYLRPDQVIGFSVAASSTEYMGEKYFGQVGIGWVASPNQIGFLMVGNNSNGSIPRHLREDATVRDMNKDILDGSRISDDVSLRRRLVADYLTTAEFHFFKVAILSEVATILEG